MKKITCSCLAIILGCGGAFGATKPWWKQATICKINETNCYGNETSGIARQIYDGNAQCWGRKFVCPNVLSFEYDDGGDGVPMNVIASDTKPDFDIDIYVPSGQCWGARRSTQNATMVSVNGTYVPVWCNNILAHVDETLPNGEITFGTQPTCATLAADNYAKILNGRCYGKYYDMSKYAVQCNGETPTLVILNGAEYNPLGQNGLTPSTANSLFGALQTSAATQRAKYFKN